MLRANRYALAAAMNGKALEPWVRALHGCDNPACVRASLPGETGLLHIIGGSQRDNMLMMARAAAAAGGCWCAVAITESRRAAPGRWRYAKRCATDGTPKPSSRHCWAQPTRHCGNRHAGNTIGPWQRVAAAGQ